MTPKVTINDVAEKVGVSKSTISQYLNNRFKYMSEETKEKIEDAIKELGYRPNALARSLKQKKTLTIGIIISNILYSFSAQVARAIEDYFYGHGYHVIVCNNDDNPVKERKYIEMLLDKQIDGLIIFPSGYNIQLFQEMAKNGFPVVLIGRKIAGIPLDTVILNNFKAAYEAVEHFVSRGHRKISLISEPLKKISPRKERLEGYRQALIDNGIEIRDDYIHNVPVPSIREKLEAMMSLPEPPTALLLGNNFVLKEVLTYVKQNQIRIPEQLSLIVFDESSYLEFFTPAISTVTHPTFEMGKKTAELLLEKMNGEMKEAKSREYIFDGLLTIRES